MRRFPFLAGVFLFSLLLFSGAAFCEQPCISKTGTFSTLYYNEEGGDLLGEEIRIVYTRFGFQATYQISEGAPSELALASIDITKDYEFEFTVPEAKLMSAGTFKGRIEADRIVGVFIFINGNEIPINLPRKKSYWD